MRIAVGCDHRGYEVKKNLTDLLTELGHEIMDQGADNEDCVDYPDIAARVSRLVAAGDADRGVLVCGTGIGMSITANKFKGVRAAICNDPVTAEISRRHNDLNVLCLAGDLLGKRNIAPLIRVWLETEFEGGRHERRLKRIRKFESNGEGCA
jgi:ribose 5-phosphate isomerase B